MAKLTMDNPYFWAGLSGVCTSIVNSTAPGDYTIMTEKALALFAEIAYMTTQQMFQLALAIWEANQDKAEGALAKA